MDKAGTIEIFLDLDGTKGYQAGGKDVLLVEHIKAGGHTIIWDAKDAKGNWVEDVLMIGVDSRFSTGMTHLPLFDAEHHDNGFIVNRISPVAETGTKRSDLYWDDSQLPGGTTEFLGVNGNNNGHNFPLQSTPYGNNRTINTWWSCFDKEKYWCPIKIFQIFIYRRLTVDYVDLTNRRLAS